MAPLNGLLGRSFERCAERRVVIGPVTGIEDSEGDYAEVLSAPRDLLAVDGGHGFAQVVIVD